MLVLCIADGQHWESSGSGSHPLHWNHSWIHGIHQRQGQFEVTTGWNLSLLAWNASLKSIFHYPAIQYSDPILGYLANPIWVVLRSFPWFTYRLISSGHQLETGSHRDEPNCRGLSGPSSIWNCEWIVSLPVCVLLWISSSHSVTPLYLWEFASIMCIF